MKLLFQNQSRWSQARSDHLRGVNFRLCGLWETSPWPWWQQRIGRDVHWSSGWGACFI